MPITGPPHLCRPGPWRQMLYNMNKRPQINQHQMMTLLGWTQVLMEICLWPNGVKTSRKKYLAQTENYRFQHIRNRKSRVLSLMIAHQSPLLWPKQRNSLRKMKFWIQMLSMRPTVKKLIYLWNHSGIGKHSHTTFLLCWSCSQFLSLWLSVGWKAQSS